MRTRAIGNVTTLFLTVSVLAATTVAAAGAAKAVRSYPTIVGGVVVLHGKHATVRLHCPATAQIRCGGEFVIRVPPGTPSAHILGSGVYKVPIGTTRTVAARFGNDTRAMLQAHPRVVARMAVHPFAGRTKIFRVTLVRR